MVENNVKTLELLWQTKGNENAWKLAIYNRLILKRVFS